MKIGTRNFYFLMWLVCLVATMLPQQVSAQKFTLVIDAGHGGHDPGAIGKKGQEKNINLAVALKLGKLIERNCPDVKVVYTRQKDVFIPLDRRAQIANNARANLFMSIHTNALPKGKILRGAETYTLGLHKTAENLEVAKRENSVILVESNYQQKYANFNPRSAESYIIFEFMQDKNMSNSVSFAKQIQNQFKRTAMRNDRGVHQAGFLVLRETTMPSVLVELGYISTPDEEQYLLSEKGTTALAQSLYNAFVSYKKGYKKPHGNAPVHQPEPIIEEEPEPQAVQKEEQKSHRQASEKPKKEQPKPATVAKSNDKDAPVFAIQILIANKKLPAKDKQFKGLSPVYCHIENKTYKYTYADNTDYNQVLKKRKEATAKFKDAFIVAYKNGKRVNVQEAIQEFKARKSKK